MINIGIFNNSLKVKSQLSSYKQDRDFDTLYYVNKALNLVIIMIIISYICVAIILISVSMKCFCCC